MAKSAQKEVNRELTFEILRVSFLELEKKFTLAGTIRLIPFLALPHGLLNQAFETEDATSSPWRLNFRRIDCLEAREAIG